MLREVKKVVDFLKFVKDPEAKLLLALLNTICKIFPAEQTSEIIIPGLVSLSRSCRATHDVDCNIVNISEKFKDVWLKLLQNCKQWNIQRLLKTGGNTG